jgi:HSP20 family protein
MSEYPFQPPDDPSQPSQPPSERPSGWEPGATPWQHSAIPPVDVVDNSGTIYVAVDLPGFKQEEIRLRGDEFTLLIAAERPDEREEGRTPVVSERPKRVERTIALPAAVDIDAATASYEDGVCTVTLPKASTEQYGEISFSS